MLKNSADKKASAILKAQVKSELEEDVINYDVIKKILVIYIDVIAILQWKKKSTQRYIIAMGQMC